MAVAYESRDLAPGVVQELRAGQEERRRRTARHSLIALLQPHTHSAAERAASRRDYFPLLQSGLQSPSSRAKSNTQLRFVGRYFLQTRCCVQLNLFYICICLVVNRSVMSSLENGTLPTASPLFSTDRTSLSL